MGGRRRRGHGARNASARNGNEIRSGKSSSRSHHSIFFDERRQSDWIALRAALETILSGRRQV